MLEKIKILTSDLLENLWITIEEIDISEQKQWNYNIKIKSPDSWLLIWQRWKNLDSLSNIIRLMTKKLSEQKIKIFLEVNDYIQSKDQNLKNTIIEKIKNVESSWKDLMLAFYNPYERKKIHSIVAEYWNKKIYTKSIWEWEERRLYICKVDEKLTIDIDWDDI